MEPSEQWEGYVYDDSHRVIKFDLTTLRQIPADDPEETLP